MISLSYRGELHFQPTTMGNYRPVCPQVSFCERRIPLSSEFFSLFFGKKMTALISIRNDFLELGIEPQIGGAISYFRTKGIDLFRPMKEAHEFAAINSGSFPLVPFSNRILKGEFSFEGKSYFIPPNWEEGDENAIHGNGWQGAWNVEDQTKTSCELVFISNGGWWPWSYEANAKFELIHRKLVMTLSIKNTSFETMPVGLGFHPYFVCAENTRFKFNATKAYLPFDEANSVDLLSSDEHFLDFKNLKSPKQLCLIDHNYDQWDGYAFIENCNGQHDLEIRADKFMRCAMMYSPVGEDYFCFEPTTHSAGAFNSENFQVKGGIVLKAGEQLSTSCSIELIR